MSNGKHYFHCWEMQLSCQPAAIGSPARRDKWDWAWRGSLPNLCGKRREPEDEFVRTQTWVALDNTSYRCPQRYLVTPAPAEHRSLQRAAGGMLRAPGAAGTPNPKPAHSLPLRAARDFKGRAFMMIFPFRVPQSRRLVQLRLRYNQRPKKGSKRAEIGECLESAGGALVPARSFPSPDADKQKPPRNHAGPFSSIHASEAPTGATTT